MFLCHFLNQSIAALAESHVLDLMPEHGGQLIFGIRIRQDATADEDLSARKGDGAFEIGVRIEMKSVWKPPLRVRRDLIPHFLKVRFDLSGLRSWRKTLHRFEFRGECRASPNFIRVGKHTSSNGTLPICQ